MKRPEPRKRTVCYLETACPIDSGLRWIRIHPRSQVVDDRAGITFIAAQPVGPAKREEVLMPIQFPDHLVIADQGGVEIRNPTPMSARSASTGNGIAMPINRTAETQTAISQKVERA